MALVTVVTIGAGAPLGQAAEAVARGARVSGNVANVHEVDPDGESLSAALADDLRRCLGVAIGSSLPPAETEERLRRLYQLTGAAVDHDRIGIRVATTFTTLAKDDPSSAEAVDRVNGLLYRWGAVIVSPGNTEPLVDWLDDTPGVEMQPGEDISLAVGSVAAAERQGRRLGSLVGIIENALARQARLNL
jgi:NAD(P)H dehydrogenase (quinone)